MSSYHRVGDETVSNLNKKIYAQIKQWRNRSIEGTHPYLYLDRMVMKRTWAGEVRNVSQLVISDACRGLVESVDDFLPRCQLNTLKKG